jgi:ATP-dependent protease ClpP protease subunit
MAKIKPRKNTPEIPIVGDVDEWETDAVKALLEVADGGECVFYIDSAGGSVYGALAVVSLMRIRKVQGTAVVIGECSSAALLLFAACRRRFVTPYSTFLFHRMRWESDKQVGSLEAKLWARHFEVMEADLDVFQGRLFGASQDKVLEWTKEGRFLNGKELATAGLAELIEV